MPFAIYYYDGTACGATLSHAFDGATQAHPWFTANHFGSLLRKEDALVRANISHLGRGHGDVHEHI